MKFGFYTLGCKVNRFETQALAQLVRAQGHEVVERDAEICIVNTCTVTSVSDHKNIRAFRKLRRLHPSALMAACGCWAQVSAEEVLAQPEIDLVCGTGDRAALIERCIAAAQGKRDTVLPAAPARSFEQLPAGIPAGRTRALLKVQDGCDNFCAYCIIPYARGRSRSMPFAAVLEETRRLTAQGVQEIVLTGIEIAAYGADLPGKPRLEALTEAVCAEAAPARVRLSSLEPTSVTQSFCQTLSGCQNLARHFHLSLQSGDDAVLRRMRRKYTTAQYLETVRALRAHFPDCSITTDLIVGFPGETEQEFARTLDFLAQCAFADVHVFPYSPRAGTRAQTMPEQIDAAVKEERATRAKAVAAGLREAYLTGFIGRAFTVLLEHETRAGAWTGHSQYAFPVETETLHGQKNKLMRVQALHIAGQGLYAKEISENS